MLDLDVQQGLTIKGCGSKAASQLFHLASLKPLPTAWNGLPNEMQTITALLTCGQKPRKAPVNKGAKPDIYHDLPPGDKTPVIVGFSGGKDSLASTIKLMRAGYIPHLYHVAGINKAYPTEIVAAETLADKLNLQFGASNVIVGGHSDYIENPVKNQYILDMMVLFGTRLGVNHYAQGNLLNDTVDEQDLSSGYSDSLEMYDAIEPYLKTINPDYQFHTLLKDDTDSLLTIIDYNINLLPYVQSCMMPLRYRKQHNARVREKYKLELMPGSCGHCYKCGIEYLHLAATRNVPENINYIDYCFELLVRELSKARGYQVTINEALDAFISEPIRSRSLFK